MIIGFVGKPSAGKSTMFKAATLADVAIASYPFTTINKNEGVGFVRVPDVAREFGKVSHPREGYVKGVSRFIPVKLIDVAGLVPGAHEGKGMGMQFLDDLRQADVLIHVVDCSGSTNERGESVDMGSHDPCKDVEFLDFELDQWYLSVLKKGWEKSARAAQQQKTVVVALAKQLSGLGVDEDMTKDVLRKKELLDKEPTSWSSEDLFSLAREFRCRTKPVVIAANKMDLEPSAKNLEVLKNKFPHLTIVPCAADLELALREADKKGVLEYIPGDASFQIKTTLTDKQRAALEYIQSKIIDVFGSTGVQNVLNTAVFNVLNYITIFPGGVSKLEDSHGNCIPDAFLMKEGSTALDFAFKLHTDLGKGFIRAIDVKTKHTVGKEHKLKHMDVIEIIARS